MVVQTDTRQREAGNRHRSVFKWLFELVLYRGTGLQQGFRQNKQFVTNVAGSKNLFVLINEERVEIMLGKELTKTMCLFCFYVMPLSIIILLSEKRRIGQRS